MCETIALPTVAVWTVAYETNISGREWWLGLENWWKDTNVDGFGDWGSRTCWLIGNGRRTRWRFGPQYPPLMPRTANYWEGLRSRFWEGGKSSVVQWLWKVGYRSSLSAFQSHQHPYGMEKLFFTQNGDLVKTVFCIFFFFNNLFGKISITISLLNIIHLMTMDFHCIVLTSVSCL